MANINLRGLDASTLSRIRASARRRKLSVNRLIVETLQEHYAKGSQRFDDLDDLAGAWSRAEAAAFEAAVAPFGEIDASLGAQSGKPAARASTRSRARRTALDARRS